jgi:hypothetical protein
MNINLLKKTKKRPIIPANAEIVDLDSEPRSKLEKRLKMSELNQKQSDEIVNRLESGPRSRIEKRAECWAVGNFSQYRKGLNGKNIVVCENCVEEKNYLACEISLGEDLSTGPLKSHFRSHHHNLFEELIRILSHHHHICGTLILNSGLNANRQAK